jgi:hypothetical protein
MTLRSEFDQLLTQPEPLGHLHHWLWEGLREGAHSKRHAWNAAAFSTLELNDQGIIAPRTRTVIIRKIDSEKRSIDFYTDVRTAKVHQLQVESRLSVLAGIEDVQSTSTRPEASNADVCWMFYRPTTKIQVRLEGIAALMSVEEDESAWRLMPLRQRANYSSIEPPGLVLPSSQPPDTSDRELTAMESDRGRENFRICRTVMRNADILYLREKGHVRARIDYLPEGGISAHWLVP